MSWEAIGAMGQQGLGSNACCRIVALVAASAISASALAAAEIQTLAQCGASTGKSYYPSERAKRGGGEAAGWVDDKISTGQFTLTRSGDDYDILFADARGAIYSSAGEGALVLKLGEAEDAISVMVHYPETTTEIYTFLAGDKATPFL